MTLGTLYQTILNYIEAQLKTESIFANDADGTRVFLWSQRILPVPGRYHLEVKAGPMENIGGRTTHSVKMEFQVIVDLLYFASAEGYEAAFLKAMAGAEKVYDLFNLTTLGGNVFKCLVSFAPGDGDFSKTMLAIPIRIIIRCEKDVRR